MKHLISVSIKPAAAQISDWRFWLIMMMGAA
jgi:hypothetical protein